MREFGNVPLVQGPSLTEYGACSGSNGCLQDFSLCDQADPPVAWICSCGDRYSGAGDRGGSGHVHGGSITCYSNRYPTRMQRDWSRSRRRTERRIHGARPWLDIEQWMNQSHSFSRSRHVRTRWGGRKLYRGSGLGVGSKRTAG